MLVSKIDLSDPKTDICLLIVEIKRLKRAVDKVSFIYRLSA
jgi:hypothetical protein